MPAVLERWEKRMRDVKRSALTAVAGVAVIALAGCGVVDSVRYPYAKESPETILDDAFEATADLKAVRVSGFVDADGGPRINFNLLNAEDGLCGGTVSFATADFDVVITRKQTYMKGSTASWQQMPGVTREEGILAAPVLANRWVTGAPNKSVDPDPLCHFVEDLTSSDSDDDDEYDVTNKGLTEAAGAKAVQLEAVNDERSLDVWVAVDEPHYLLKIAVEEKKGSIEIVLSDFDFAGEVSMPPKKDILDTTNLTAEDFTGRSG